MKWSNDFTELHFNLFSNCCMAGCVFATFFFWNAFQTSVHIFLPEHPFLNVSYKHPRLSTVIVIEGKKKFVFEPKVTAVPPPDLIAW